MRGPHVFAGYYRNRKATAEVLDDEGWLRSGDLGSIDDDGFLRITGRKKDLIITSSGKNITPVNIEAAIRESRWVSQAVVYGDEHSYLVAVVTLDPDELPALAEHGLTPEEAVQQAVDEANTHFARIEQVKRFAILDHDLTQEGGELTPTMKVKRAVVYDLYRDVFEGLYEESAS
jgi:long-chain acyl-CoA synthetase